MEELIKALNTIKEECEKHNMCEECPMSCGEDCRVRNNRPDRWVIKQEPVQMVKVMD